MLSASQAETRRRSRICLSESVIGVERLVSSSINTMIDSAVEKQVSPMKAPCPM